MHQISCKRVGNWPELTVGTGSVRYLFQIVRNDSIFNKDEGGQIFSTVEDAKPHALIIARQLIEDAGRDGHVVTIMDQIGTEVARLPIAP